MSSFVSSLAPVLTKNPIAVDAADGTHSQVMRMPLSRVVSLYLTVNCESFCLQYQALLRGWTPPSLGEHAWLK